MNRPDQLFRVITAADWRRSIAQARTQPNLVLEKIRAKCAEVRRAQEARR